MNNSKRYLVPLLILIILISLIIGFRSFMMTNIIQPIALFFWAIWRLITSVDQNTYWMLLILICIIMVIYLVVSGKTNPIRSAYHETNHTLNRIEHWQKLIEDASLGESEREYLRENLVNLLEAANTQVERFGATEPIGIEHNQKETSLSPSAQRFLDLSSAKSGRISIKQQINFLFLTPKWFRRWIRQTFYRDNTLIDEILQNMENKLEISNDR